VSRGTFDACQPKIRARSELTLRRPCMDIFFTVCAMPIKRWGAASILERRNLIRAGFARKQLIVDAP